jgi:hypothetical protein
VLILSTSKSYIFVIFFKQFFGICLFGTPHLTPTLTPTLTLARIRTRILPLPFP